MTQNRTRKPRKTAASKTEPQQPEAMDPGVREQSAPEAQVSTPRACYAAQTLADEVLALFEVHTEFGEPNARNVALRVGFVDSKYPDLYSLLVLTESDERVLAVDSDGDSVLVSFHNSLRTQDSRAPFGLAEAYDILSANDEAILLDENADFVLDKTPEDGE